MRPLGGVTPDDFVARIAVGSDGSAVVLIHDGDSTRFYPWSSAGPAPGSNSGPAIPSLAPGSRGAASGVTAHAILPGGGRSLILGHADGTLSLIGLGAASSVSAVQQHDAWVCFISVDSENEPPLVTSIAADGSILVSALEAGALNTIETRQDAMFRLHDAPGAPRQGVDNLPDGAVFREPGCDVCPEMVIIPAGTFTMGSSEEEGRSFHEGPQHDVSVPRFAQGADGGHLRSMGYVPEGGLLRTTPQ